MNKKKQVVPAKVAKKKVAPKPVEKPKPEAGKVPCPKIIVYEAKNAPHESLTWLAMFNGFSQASEPGKSKYHPLPTSFWGRTEVVARARATDWWAEEQAKERRKKEYVQAQSARRMEELKIKRERVKLED